MKGHHSFLDDPNNKDKWGNIKDGSICPRCNQPRKGLDFLSKKDNVYVPVCITCRRKHGLLKDSSAGLDTPFTSRLP